MADQFTQDFRTQRRNYDDGLTRIGEIGRLWYESANNTIRISDGVTPGGIIVAGGGSGTGGGLIAGDNVSLLTNDAGYITLTDLSATGDIQYNSATGVFSVTTYKSTDFNTDFAAKTTDDLSEGLVNLYYTDQRVSGVIQSTAIDASTLNGLASTAFATAAQGTLADSALQPLDNITELTNNAGYTTLTDFSASGDLSYNNLTGTFSVTTYKSTDFDSDFATKTTDDLSEGTVNVYFSDSRVDARVADTSISALLDVDNDLVVNLDEDSILIYNSTGNQFVAESFLSILDRLKAELEVMYDRLVDEDGAFTYIGEADPGTARTSALWRIKRVQEYPDGDIDILWANGTAAFDKVWDSRATYTY